VTKQLDINNVYAPMLGESATQPSSNNRKPLKQRTVLNGSLTNCSALQQKLSNQRLDQILTFPNPEIDASNTTRSSSINLIHAQNNNQIRAVRNLQQAAMKLERSK